MSGYRQDTPVSNKKGVWYFIEGTECPVCGRYKEYRTRMPGPKPKCLDVLGNYDSVETHYATHDYHQQYCGCLY